MWHAGVQLKKVPSVGTWLEGLGVVGFSLDAGCEWASYPVTYKSNDTESEIWRCLCRGAGSDVECKFDVLLLLDQFSSVGASNVQRKLELAH